ncbi:MAG TPA: PH domain-containing protein [Chthoniobacterales bacterium]|nr:PH domain-containing protein [Chthoniobacterales bacterium]
MYKAFRSWTERLLRIPDDPDAPPGDETTTRLFRAAPNYYRYLLVTWVLRTLIAVAVVVPMEIIPMVTSVTRAIDRIPQPFIFRAPLLIIGIVIVQRLFALALVRLDFEKRWYLVTNRSLRVREGVVKVREMTITFANIQNISISQGPIQRLLGIADLRVDTAGGGSQKKEHSGEENLHGVRFRGVNNAEEIRDLINTRLRALKDSGLGDRDDVAPVQPTPTLASLGALTEPLRDVLSEATALREAVARSAAA